VIDSLPLLQRQDLRQGFSMHAMISTIFFLAQQAPAAGGAPQPDLLQTLLPFLFMGVIFYFLLIRPQQKRQKQHQQLLANLKTGDRVVTSSGIHGLIANVKETTFLLKVADNVKIEVDKSAVSGIEKSAETKPAVSEAKPTT
ncbi:MAG TPA: preprotein translocase subunit YajC, partial [Chthoniobacterales bacterium]|nr:preprotein translocase subunit YajC [Chthoniobacterales bacterium]